jgi:hypothetical protein
MFASKKNCSFLCKGVFIPGIVIFASLIISIINFDYPKVISENCGKITGYLDGDLYTDAQATGDSNVMIVLFLYFLIFFIFNYCIYKGFISSIHSSGKQSYYIINALYSLGAPIIGMLWMDFPEPLIPANVYFSFEDHFIELQGVQLTYLQDGASQVRIIMASESFQGFESYLAPGPWMVPFSFSWMNNCLGDLVNFQSLLKKLFIAFICTSSTLAGFLIFASFVRFRNHGRIQINNQEEHREEHLEEYREENQDTEIGIGSDISKEISKEMDKKSRQNNEYKQGREKDNI